MHNQFQYWTTCILWSMATGQDSPYIFMIVKYQLSASKHEPIAQEKANKANKLTCIFEKNNKCLVKLYVSHIRRALNNAPTLNLFIHIGLDSRFI